MLLEWLNYPGVLTNSSTGRVNSLTPEVMRSPERSTFFSR